MSPNSSSMTLSSSTDVIFLSQQPATLDDDDECYSSSQREGPETSRKAMLGQAGHDEDPSRLSNRLHGAATHSIVATVVTAPSLPPDCEDDNDYNGQSLPEASASDAATDTAASPAGPAAFDEEECVDDEDEDDDASGSFLDSDDGDGCLASIRGGQWLQRANSRMSLGAQTLSSAFSLNDLGSTGTISSLELDVDPHIDADDHGSVEGGVIAWDGQFVNGSYSLRDDIDDECCSGGTSPLRQRRMDQREEMREIRDVFCQFRKDTQAGKTERGRNHVEVERDGGPDKEKPSDVEYDAACQANDDYDTALQRTISRMHQSMAITGLGAPPRGGSPRKSKAQQVASRDTADIVSEEDEEEFFVLEDDDESQTADHRIRNNSFDDLYTESDNNMPTNLLAAKQFLTGLAMSSKERPERTQSSMNDASTDDRRGPVAPQSPNRHYMSPHGHHFPRRRVHSRDSMASSEYTEVLVSSDDSFGFGEEDGCGPRSEDGTAPPSPGSQYTASPRTRHTPDPRRAVCGGPRVVTHEEVIDEHIEEEEEEYDEEVIDDDDDGVQEEVIVEEEVDTHCLG